MDTDPAERGVRPRRNKMEAAEEASPEQETGGRGRSTHRSSTHPRQQNDQNTDWVAGTCGQWGPLGTLRPGRDEGGQNDNDTMPPRYPVPRPPGSSSGCGAGTLWGLGGTRPAGRGNNGGVYCPGSSSGGDLTARGPSGTCLCGRGPPALCRSGSSSGRAGGVQREASHAAPVVMGRR